MVIIGVDYHPSFQTIAFVVEETGECGEQNPRFASRYVDDLEAPLSLRTQ